MCLLWNYYAYFCFTWMALKKLWNSTLLMASSNSSNIHAARFSFRLFLMTLGHKVIVVVEVAFFYLCNSGLTQGWLKFGSCLTKKICLKFVLGLTQICLMFVSCLSHACLRFDSGLTQVWLRFDSGLTQVCWLRFVSVFFSGLTHVWVWLRFVSCLF